MTTPLEPQPAPPANLPPAPPAPPQTFTVEDLERARREERDKLYGRLTNTGEKLKTLEEEMQLLRGEREQRLAAEAEARKQAEDLARQKEADELSVKDLLAKREKDWQAQQDALKQEMETRMAILQREASHAQLKAYIQKRVAQESGNIEESLIDLITGSTEQEVEASIADMKQRSTRILENAKKAFGGARAAMPGVSPAAGAAIDPAANPGGQQYTPEQIQAMNNREYAEFRKKIGMDQAGASVGIFG